MTLVGKKVPRAPAYDALQVYSQRNTFTTKMISGVSKEDSDPEPDKMYRVPPDLANKSTDRMVGVRP